LQTLLRDSVIPEAFAGASNPHPDCRSGMRIRIPLAVALLTVLHVSTPSQAQTKPQAPTALAVPQNAAKPVRFDILAFNVAGNTVLPVDVIEAAVYPFLGPDRQASDVDAARAALEKAYQARGYLSVVVSVPRQDAIGGEVRLDVQEAAIGALRVTGAAYNLPSRIKEGAPSVAPGKVPNFDDVQSDLARLQAQPDLQITPLLAAAAEPGKLDVDLKVQDALPLHGSVELNNKQSYNTERGRLEASVRYENLFQRQHALGATWIYSPRRPSQANTLVMNYALPLQADGAADAADDKLSLVALWSRSGTPTSLGGATVVRGRQWGARYRMPLTTRAQSLSGAWQLGLDYKDNADGNQAVAGFTTQNPDLKYGVGILGADLSVPLSGGGQLGGDTTFATSTGLFGNRTIDCNGVQRKQFDCKRAGAAAGFATLKTNASWRSPAFAGFTATARLQTQLATGPLVSSEQFGVGGVDSVRGYYEFEQAGDVGASAQIELVSPSWSPGSGLSVNALLFVDGAILNVLEALPGQLSEVRLRSQGVGLRMRAATGSEMRLNVAWPRSATVKPDSQGQLVPVSGSASSNKLRFDLSVVQPF
jgi:hemolysin activation/secretion protein